MAIGWNRYTGGNLPICENHMENQRIIAFQHIFSSRLDTVSHFLDVAERHFADDLESLLQYRIAPDMLPFGTQIAFTCNQPRNFALWGLGQSANNLNPEVTSLDLCRDHIATTQALLALHQCHRCKAIGGHKDRVWARTIRRIIGTGIHR